MTEDEKWYAQQYPWELADCGMCLTMHADFQCEHHPDLSTAASTAEIPYPAEKVWGKPTLEDKREEAVVIREQFAQYYTKTKAKEPKVVFGELAEPSND
jgi:hypothetical protein